MRSADTVRPDRTVRVDDVDPHDNAAWNDWYAAWSAGWRADRDPGAPVETARTMRARALAPPDDRVLHVVRATDGTGPGASACFGLPQRDNQHVLTVDIATHPASRRRGLARALLAEAERRARAAGRRLLVAELCERLDGSDNDGTAFARASGFSRGVAELRRELRLPVPPDRLAALERTARAAAGYELRSWRDRIPDDLVDGRAVLSRRLSEDAPVDDLDYGPETWDAARWRRAEDRTAAAGCSVHGVVALAPDGTVAGATEIEVTEDEPGTAFQSDTVVERAHRGHRLGLALKLAALRTLDDCDPPVERVHTWNAASNAPMIAVNDAMGYVVAEAAAEWQKGLDEPVGEAALTLGQPGPTS